MMQLPDFLIIGAMRCGTTTLSNILKTQINIFMPKVKEIHFFDQRNPDIDSVNAYSQLFDQANDKQIKGEATPDYLSTPGSIGRIYEVIPNAKLLLILRDPVKRTCSHYRFSVFWEREVETLEKALKLENERLSRPIHEHDIFFSYLQRSRYIEHIRTILKYFDRSQLHVLFLEDLYTHPEQTIASMFNFLEIDNLYNWHDALQISNQSSIINIKRGEQLDDKTKLRISHNNNVINRMNSIYLKWLPLTLKNQLYRFAESNLLITEKINVKTLLNLKNYFEPYNRQLAEHLDCPLPW